MKVKTKTILVLSAMLFIITAAMSMTSMGVLASPSDNFGNVDVEVSEAGGREKWFDAKWHNRLFLKVMVKDAVPRRGRIIKYKIDLEDVVDLDPNSIRLIFNLTEIPFDYDSINGIITFVLDYVTDSTDILQYTLYYDTISNGLKPVPEYHPEWAMDLVEGYNNGSLEQSLSDERSSFYAENNISEVSGIYYYGDYKVYEVGGNYYYENGTEVNGNILVEDIFGNGYYMIDIAGTTYEVTFDNSTGTWIYLENSTAIDTVVIVSNLYTVNDLEIHYNSSTVPPQWEYVNLTSGEMIGYAYLDNATNISYFYELNESSGTFYLSMYHDANNEVLTVYVLNTSSYVAIPLSTESQDFYLGGQLYDDMVNAISFSDGLSVTDFNVGNVEATVTSQAPFDYNGANYTETLTTSAYLGSPNILISGENDVPAGTGSGAFEFGSVLINFNGTIVAWNGTDYEVIPLFSDEWHLWSQIKVFELGIYPYLQAYYSYEEIYGPRLQNIMEQYEIILGNYTFDFGDFDYDIDGVDLTGIYDTGKDPLAFDEYSLDVIPILMKGNHFAIHDKVNGETIAMKLNGPSPYTNLLVELWRETMNDVINGTPVNVSMNYYLNLSFNYIDWWANQGTGALQEAVDFVEGERFEALLTYFESTDPETVLGTLQTTYEDANLTELYNEGAIPVNVTIHSPTPGTDVDEGSDLLINITVAGETLAEVQYKINVDGILMDFEEWNAIMIGTGNNEHMGRRMSAVRKMEQINSATLYILAYDTNGTVVMAQTPFIVNGSLVDEWTWTITIGSVGFIMSLLGLAVARHNKTMKKKKGTLKTSSAKGKGRSTKGITTGSVKGKKVPKAKIDPSKCDPKTGKCDI
jgi:hypothetical protein